jgi:DNA-binding response OmpR family regulator
VSPGSKILVVEDNYLLAEVVSEFVIECGMVPVGPASGLEAGLMYAREAALDAAILDINLDNRLCFPICDLLAERGIPFAFLTGYSHLSMIPLRFRTAPLVSKPFDPDELRGVIEGMLIGRQDGPLVRASSSIARLAAAS